VINAKLDDPLAVVLAFANDYTHWESRVARTRDGLQNSDFQNQITEIIRSYCTNKKRAYVDGVYSYAQPPVNEQVVEANISNVEQITRTRAYVDTNKLQGNAYRFVVLKKKDGWRIDSVKWRFSDNDEWKNTLIGS